jgi:Ca2+-binding RTX toxin-like protein
MLGATGTQRNAFIIFDHHGPNDFKFAGAYEGTDKWTIGRLNGVTIERLAEFSEPIRDGQPYDVMLLLDADRATLYVDGASKVSHAFGEAINDGLIGPGTINAKAEFDDFSIRAGNLNPMVAVPHDPPTAPGEVAVQRDGDYVVATDVPTGEVLLKRPLEATLSLVVAGIADRADTLTVDMATGGPFTLPDGIVFLGRTGDSDRLAVVQPPGDSIYTLGNSMITTPEIDVTYGGVEQIQITDLGGDDTYILSTRSKQITLEDGDGEDTLDFSNAIKQVNLRLFYSDGTSQWVNAGNNRLALMGEFEIAVGTPYADKMTGNDADNVIHAGAGNDVVYGRAGNDLLAGGDGDDTLVGNAGGDVLIGGLGDDALNGGGGPDTLDGGDGSDVLIGGKGHDLLRGGNGADSLKGSDGDDILLGGWGQDEILGGLGRDVLIGGNGPDTLQGSVGEDILIGSSTAHDGDDAALRAILAEWRTARPIDDRIANLQTGGGLTGGVTLDGSVVDDALADMLEGSWSADWFIVFPGDTFAPGEPTPGDRVTYK